MMDDELINKIDGWIFLYGYGEMILLSHGAHGRRHLTNTE